MSNGEPTYQARLLDRVTAGERAKYAADERDRLLAACVVFIDQALAYAPQMLPVNSPIATMFRGAVDDALDAKAETR